MERGGKEGEQRHRVGLAWAAWNHFKWCGGWKAKRCTERGDESGRKAVKGGQGWTRDGIWAKILT